MSFSLSSNVSSTKAKRFNLTKLTTNCNYTALLLVYTKSKVASDKNNSGCSGVEAKLKVVVRAEILPRDFRQTLGKYYLPLTIAKFKVLKHFTVKKIRQFLKALTVKLSTFQNKTTSHPEILTDS